ncbi:ABC transporter permease subunit [Mameliella alba]|uniref:ABC transporter permease subunit n=1 Tax=Mameliella alba TaxID=561184 RepID=UPI001C97E1A4|nr:ABC transporter permease subunit [Mameliella alba]MBY6120390.1 ABC transporter permease subunit [Mameliella alba]
MRSHSILPVGIWPFALFLTALLGVPLIILALSSFWWSEFFVISRDLTLGNYTRLLEESVFLKLVGRSIGIGLLVSAITVPVAFVMAYAIRFYFRRHSNLLLVLVMVSMLSSYLVRIYAWKSILGVNGVVNQLLLSIGAIDAPLGFLLYGDFAVVITLVHILLPFSVLPIYASLQDVDDSLIEAARDLGSTSARSVFQVALPMARPGLVAAFLFSLILASADYVTPQLVGGRNGIMVGRAIADQFGMAGNPPFGAALSLVLILGFAIVIGISVLVATLTGPLYWRVISLGQGRRRARGKAGDRSLRRVFRGLTVLALVFLFFPLVIVVLFSFNASPSGIFPIESFSLRWYRELFASPAFLKAAKSSLVVAALSVSLTLVLGVPAAFVLARRDFLAKPLMLALTLGPIATPGIVIGTSLLASLGMVGMHGGLFPTVLAHVLFTLPFVVMVTRARLASFDWELEDAGRDLGLRPVKIFFKVTLPIIAPAMIGAGILVAALSIDEFIITNFVIGANTTLPVYIWGQMRTGITPSVNAVATVILFASIALMAIAAWVSGTRTAVSGLAGRN